MIDAPVVVTMTHGLDADAEDACTMFVIVFCWGPSVITLNVVAAAIS